jgi:hypothetical protein
MNTYFTQISVSDTMEATMQTWIAQKYTCVEESAVQLGLDFVFLMDKLRIYATSVLFNVIVERNIKTQVPSMSDLRLTFCQQAPYVIWDSDISTYRGAWLDVINEISKERNWTTSYVVPPESAVSMTCSLPW